MIFQNNTWNDIYHYIVLIQMFADIGYIAVWGVSLRAMPAMCHCEALDQPAGPRLASSTVRTVRILKIIEL
jgi:hypothetical protein